MMKHSSTLWMANLGIFTVHCILRIFCYPLVTKVIQIESNILRLTYVRTVMDGFQASL